MENFNIIKFSQSQPNTPAPSILSPSPLKKAAASRINSNVARELFSTVNEEIEVDPFGRNSESPSNFMRAKFFSLRADSDSSSNEWSSDSSCSNCLDLEFESPSKKSLTKNPFCGEQIFDEITNELPSRSSNPITNNAEFQMERAMLMGSTRSNLSAKAQARLAEFF